MSTVPEAGCEEPEFGAWRISVPRNCELSSTGIALIKRLFSRFAALGIVVVLILFILLKKYVFLVFQIKK